ncbi:hypothetical protein FD09_GL000535 [Schleiferilactobacillus perolens DSM 12744]|uniref:Uncharacterized protein n=2 Tax=Schleiferilactobacillus perolens TaxID=100468 RepID=A0A0R1MUR5_9LACO|nr:hypothetical protein FD09_GL000535 [Schleiferilactobacillus perolens DSM 12744]
MEFMLNIGVMGLGTIATKAYLPVYAAMQDQVHWRLMTRNEEKLHRLGQQFNLPIAGNNVAALDVLPLDAVMIHTPTKTHYDLVRHFLNKGISVFVDKPLATNIDQVKDLYALAEKQGVLLTVGFNRRFAPLHQTLAHQSDKTAVRVMKTRLDQPDEPFHALYDLMIHPVDTALALAGFPETAKVDHFAIQKNAAGQLLRAEVALSAPHMMVSAGIDEAAGANLEEATVTTSHGIYRVQDLSRLITIQGTTQTQTYPSDWAPILVTRGFSPLVHAFVDAVVNHGDNPVSPQTSILSHQVIAELAAQALS